MHSREQYLERVREEYGKAGKREKTRLLNEARKRTRLNRKVLIRKLAHPPQPNPGQRSPRKATYGVDLVAALVQVWEMFDWRPHWRRVRRHRDSLGKPGRRNQPLRRQIRVMSTDTGLPLSTHGRLPCLTQEVCWPQQKKRITHPLEIGLHYPGPTRSYRESGFDYPQPPMV